MRDQKNKILLFLLGISLGALAGGTVVFLRLSDRTIHVNETIIERIANRVYRLTSLQKEKDSNSNEEVVDTISTKTPATKVPLAAKPPVKDQSLPPDGTEVFIDSVKADTVKTVQNTELSNEDQEIIVKKDELISSKFVELVDAEEKTERKSVADSLLEKVSGIKGEKKNTGKVLVNVEFWKSPVNYKGYKMGKNKLVLFGLDPEKPVLLFFVEDQSYLKYDQTVFKLENHNDFSAFEQVVDPLILEKI